MAGKRTTELHLAKWRKALANAEQQSGEIPEPSFSKKPPARPAARSEFGNAHAEKTDQSSIIAERCLSRGTIDSSKGSYYTVGLAPGYSSADLSSFIRQWNTGNKTDFELMFSACKAGLVTMTMRDKNSIRPSTPLPPHEKR